LCATLKALELARNEIIQVRFHSLVFLRFHFDKIYSEFPKLMVFDLVSNAVLRCYWVSTFLSMWTSWYENEYLWIVL